MKKIGVRTCPKCRHINPEVCKRCEKCHEDLSAVALEPGVVIRRRIIAAGIAGAIVGVAVFLIQKNCGIDVTKIWWAYVGLFALVYFPALRMLPVKYEREADQV